MLNELGIKSNSIINNNKKKKRYVFYIFFLSIVLTLSISLIYFFDYTNIIKSITLGILTLIPISEIVIQLLNYILSKEIKPKTIPKLDLSKGVPEEYSTFVVIPTILDSEKKVKEMIKKLEVYYLANKENNIYFALLGDCIPSKNEKEKIDDEIIKTGLEETHKLNKKYIGNKNCFPIFHFLYRKRTWNSNEECYLGWERKRGLLCQFNDFLINDNDIFLENTIQKYSLEKKRRIPKIKYIITLDQDTNLILGSAVELIGAMAHVLNKPILSKKEDKVIYGHAIIQPRIGVNLEASRKSLFTKIYAGLGGIDSYTNAISDIYQDNFDEGIFTGKGIYDLEVFHKALCDEIPENKVLSHDLLEGNYLRCGFASDILLIDDYPKTYISNTLRQARWIRGDYQIAGWIKRRITIKNKKVKQNPLRTFI